MEGQLDPLAADAQRVALAERDVRCGPGGVVVAQQQATGLFVPDPDRASLEEARRTGMVRVVVGVDEVGDPVGHAFGGGDLVHGATQVVPDGRRGVEQHDTLGSGQERRQVGPVGDPEQVPLDPADVVAVLVQGRAQRGGRHGRVVGQGRGAACVRCGGHLCLLGLGAPPSRGARYRMKASTLRLVICFGKQSSHWLTRCPTGGTGFDGHARRSLPISSLSAVRSLLQRRLRARHWCERGPTGPSRPGPLRSTGPRCVARGLRRRPRLRRGR